MRRDAGSVVGDVEANDAVHLVRLDGDVGPAVTERVREQVRQDLVEPVRTREDDEIVADRHLHRSPAGRQSVRDRLLDGRRQ